jgi:hypothetical protein
MHLNARKATAEYKAVLQCGNLLLELINLPSNP